jgi:hypothetical protein
VFLHFANSEAMPCWPDTVSMGIAFGFAAVLMVSKARTDRAMKRRLWQSLKTGTSSRPELISGCYGVAERPRAVSWEHTHKTSVFGVMYQCTRTRKDVVGLSIPITLAPQIVLLFLYN